MSGKFSSDPFFSCEGGKMFDKFGTLDLCVAWIAIGACLAFIGMLCWDGYDDYRRKYGKKN